MVLEKDMVKRAQALALALAGLDNQAIGDQMGITRQRIKQLIPTVRTVRVRFTEAERKALAILAEEDNIGVAQLIRKALKLP